MTYRKAFFSLVTPSEENTLLKHQATIFDAEGEADIFGKQSFDPSLRDEEKKVNTKEEDKRHSINV